MFRMAALALGRKSLRLAVVFVFGLLVANSAARAQCVSLTTAGSASTQNFNTLSNTAGTTTNNLTITGWFLTESGGGTRDNEQYGVDTGGSSTGDTYSYGAAGNTERALGALQSGTLISTIGACFTNNTGSTITNLAVAYTGEQWRIGNTAAARDDRLDFQYSLDATSLTTGTWTDVNSLDFTNPIKTSASAGALDGNSAANRTAITSTISSLSIANGATVWIRWNDLNASGADDGLAVDDFSLTPNPGGLPSLSINDVSQSEGNSGQTAFTFTVSLSSSTHGGVTFDIATADGTATTANNDYAANSATGVSIPNGQQSAQFTVQVNGDTTGEPNETFFVNVTNVTGANVSDGQGQGTITNDDFSLTLISAVQGNGTASPLAGQTVSVRGIVTLLKSNGFFLQEETADNDSDPNTSEGIFVFTSSAPTVSVGDQVTVTASVVEFNNLTELTSPSISINSTGNSLPTAVTITAADLPANANYTQPQLEKYEGMRLFASSLTTVAPNDGFFDVFTVITGQPRPMREPGIEADLPIPPDPTSGTTDPNIPIFDLNPERILIDTNGRAGSTGETITSNVTITNLTGPLDFAFGAYRIINESALTRTADMSAVAVPTPTANEFTVAGYNIENFNNNATQRAKAAQTICNVLRQPDIIGTVEIFDLADLQALANEVQTLCGVAYSSHLIEQDGTSEDNDQDVGFLVKTSRVSVTSVTAERTSDTFINPNTGNPETTHDRPPLLLRGTVDPSGASPQPVLVVVNHLRSFIDVELVAGEGPRVRAKRKAQAESLAGLLQELQVNNPTANVISVGDYNAFQFNSGYDDSISVLKGNPTPDDQIVVDQSPDLVNPNFYNLIDDLPATDRYTFIFEGTPQSLDHHLVNSVAKARNTRTAVARVNADFPEVTASVYASNASRPERNSDHDPVVSYYTLAPTAQAGQLIISEFRHFGPNGAEDEFVEIYNNTNAPHTVLSSDGSAGYSVATASNQTAGTTRFIILNGTVIPARGHILAVNTDGYSLTNYGGSGAAAGDLTFTDDIPTNAGLALFNTANTANFSTSTRLDSVGSASESNTLYKEGTGYPDITFVTTRQYSFYRDLASGNPKDTGNNAADLIYVNTDGTNDGPPARLGAPGPENLSSPVVKSSGSQLAARMIDTCTSSSSPPNRQRVTGSYTDTLSSTGTYSLGYLDIRRRFHNLTGGNVTRLRFRISDMTTSPSPAGTADLRAVTSPNLNVTVSGACGGATVPVTGTTLEQPPTQSIGGGLNSTLSAGTITLGSPLAPGTYVDVNFRLAVAQSGGFRFFIIVEALP